MIETQREAHVPRGTVGLGDICREQETLFSGEEAEVGEVVDRNREGAEAEVAQKLPKQVEGAEGAAAEPVLRPQPLQPGQRHLHPASRQRYARPRQPLRLRPRHRLRSG